MSPFDATITTPKDAYEDKRLADVHPQAWANPTPADRYALIIVGAGSAGIAAAELAIAMGVSVSDFEARRWVRFAAAATRPSGRPARRRRASRRQSPNTPRDPARRRQPAPT